MRIKASKSETVGGTPSIDFIISWNLTIIGEFDCASDYIVNQLCLIEKERLDITLVTIAFGTKGYSINCFQLLW